MCRVAQTVLIAMMDERLDGRAVAGRPLRCVLLFALVSMQVYWYAVLPYCPLHEHRSRNILCNLVSLISIML